jgi:hypothetical protein
MNQRQIAAGELQQASTCFLLDSNFEKDESFRATLQFVIPKIFVKLKALSEIVKTQVAEQTGNSGNH